MHGIQLDKIFFCVGASWKMLGAGSNETGRQEQQSKSWVDVNPN